MGAEGEGMTVTVNIDELGPVDWIVVEFPGTKLTGEIAPIIKDYVDRGLIKVLDLLFLKKDQDGSLEAFEASDLGDSEIGGLRDYERDLAMVLSEQDVADLAETIEPGSSAAVLVWENLWAAPFGAAVRHAGGQLAASGRIPDPSGAGRHRGRRRGRSLRCHLQPDAAGGPLPPSAVPRSSPTACTAGATGARTAAMTGATGARTAATTGATGARTAATASSTNLGVRSARPDRPRGGPPRRLAVCARQAS